jgi:hypothetical protein
MPSTNTSRKNAETKVSPGQATPWMPGELMRSAASAKVEM